MHKLLQRQIQRCFGDNVPPELVPFIEAVDATYNQADIDRRRLERSIQLASNELQQANSDMRAVYERLVESSADGIFAFDRSFQITVWNPSMTRISGWRTVDVLNKNAFDLFPELYASSESQLLSNTLDGKTGTIEGRIVFASFAPPEAFFECAYMPLLGEKGAVTGGLGTVRDITERKKVDRLKNEFVSTISHELRTPLTSVFGSLSLLLGGVTTNLPLQAQSILQIAHRNTERLIRLINDILDIEKMELGKMHFDFRCVDLVQIAQQTVEANRAFGDRLGVRFVLHQPESQMLVFGDPDRLTQVFTNLLSNAAKHSPPGETVIIQVKQHVNIACVSITDVGEGIPESFHSHIFQKFAQADGSNTRQKGGTGLGLSIAKAIIDVHHGTISFETQLGHGTTFYVELPMNSNF